MSADDRPQPPIPVALLKDPAVLLATGFGIGLLRPGPGTWGTLLAVPPALLLAHLPVPVAAAVIALGAVIGVPLCGRAGQRIGVADHGGIVWDEIIGFWLTSVFLVSGWLDLALAFALFRLFDIAKPWPVSWADRRLPGGWGVMADDLLAGCYAAGSLWLVQIALAMFFGGI